MAARSFAVFLALATVAGAAAGAHARIIELFSLPSGPGMGDLVSPAILIPVATPAPNNGLSPLPSPNQVTLAMLPFEVLGPIYTGFTVLPSGGTTTYLVRETARNDTDKAWTGFALALGSFHLTPTSFQPFSDIPLPPALAPPVFASPAPPPTASAFGTVIADAFTLRWTQGVVAPGDTLAFAFSLVVPDDLAGSNLYSMFTLQATPLIPEPSTLLLLALGALGLLLARRRTTGPGRGAGSVTEPAAWRT